MFREPLIKYVPPMRLIQKDIPVVDSRTAYSYANCPSTALAGLYRQVAIKVVPASWAVRKLRENVQRSLKNLPKPPFFPMQMEDYLNKVKGRDKGKYKQYYNTYSALMNFSKNNLKSQYYTSLVKTNEFHLINDKGEQEGRVRNICNPSDEWKVVGGFIQYILYNVMLCNLSTSVSGYTYEDLQLMFDARWGKFLNMDGSSHDASQHHSLLSACIHQVIRHYEAYIKDSLDMSGLIHLWPQVKVALYDMTFILTSGEPLNWRAVIKGTMFSG